MENIYCLIAVDASIELLLVARLYLWLPILGSAGCWELWWTRLGRMHQLQVHAFISAYALFSTSAVLCPE